MYNDNTSFLTLPKRFFLIGYFDEKRINAHDPNPGTCVNTYCGKKGYIEKVRDKNKEWDNEHWQTAPFPRFGGKMLFFPTIRARHPRIQSKRLSKSLFPAPLIITVLTSRHG